MKPGERIPMIAEAAKDLLTRPWAEAQLILDQFGFHTYESEYNIDEHSYFIQQIKDGEDGQVAGLYGYLRGEKVQTDPADAPWSGQPLRLFLSHIHQERVFAGNLKEALAGYGIDGFVAHNDIQPSKRWRDVIKAGLSTCDAFAALLHPRFHDSQWCDQEVGWSVGRGIPIITIRHPEAPRRDGFLEEHQDLVLPTSAGPRSGEYLVAQKVLEILVRDPRTNAVGVRALAEAFANSGSYDAARRWYGLLTQQASIESPQLRRLEQAVQTNSQVSNAVYGGPSSSRRIPDLIAELVQRHEPKSFVAVEEEEPF